MLESRVSWEDQPRKEKRPARHATRRAGRCSFATKRRSPASSTLAPRHGAAQRSTGARINGEPGSCSFTRHGTYRRKWPRGTLIARWYCRRAGPPSACCPTTGCETAYTLPRSSDDLLWVLMVRVAVQAAHRPPTASCPHSAVTSDGPSARLPGGPPTCSGRRRCRPAPSSAPPLERDLTRLPLAPPPGYRPRP